MSVLSSFTFSKRPLRGNPSMFFIQQTSRNYWALIVWLNKPVHPVWHTPDIWARSAECNSALEHFAAHNCVKPQSWFWLWSNISDPGFLPKYQLMPEIQRDRYLINDLFVSLFTPLVSGPFIDCSQKNIWRFCPQNTDTLKKALTEKAQLIFFPLALAWGKILIKFNTH
jgi:hypothetical protein